MNYYLSLRNEYPMKKLFLSAVMLSSTLATHITHTRLEVICGPMFAGKSEELIRRLHRIGIAQRSHNQEHHVLVVKPKLDSRGATNVISSHNGNTYDALAIQSPQDLLDLVAAGNYEVIAIDEVQFFSHDIVDVIRTLVVQGKRVIVAGLDLDYRSEPFGPIAAILALADSVTKLQAICTQCGEDACRSQRIINGEPARYSDPLIMIGAEEAYQARCKKCYSILP
jgi:thymidine kinase